jgi:hypothetical protein
MRIQRGYRRLCCRNSELHYTGEQDDDESGRVMWMTVTKKTQTQTVEPQCANRNSELELQLTALSHKKLSPLQTEHLPIFSKCK